MMLADRLLERDNPWTATFSSTRMTPRRSAAGVAKETLKDVRHLVAVHRDDAGDLHGVSPACSHLGCRLTWNTAERSWDCPCHGSRFAPDGAVLQGPATRPLTLIPVPATPSTEASGPAAASR